MRTRCFIKAFEQDGITPLKEGEHSVKITVDKDGVVMVSDSVLAITTVVIHAITDGEL